MAEGVRSLARAFTAARGARRMKLIRRVLACMLVGVLGTAARAAAQTPDTIRVVNTATGSFVSEGLPGTTSASNVIVIQLSAGVRLEPPREAEVRVGTRYVFAHILTNTGNGRDRFELTTDGPAGWPLSVYIDANGDGALDAGDTPVTGWIALQPEQSQALLLVVDVPADAALQPAEVSATATSEMDAQVSATVTDRLYVLEVAPDIEITKTVDRERVTIGDTVVYTIRANNRGDGAAAEVLISDTLPQGLLYVAGSLRLNNAALSDAGDSDAGSVTVAAGTHVVAVSLAEFAPGFEANITFRAVIGPSAGTTIRNIAVLSHSGAIGSVSTETTPVITPVQRPDLSLLKELLGADSVRVGELVQFRISWHNLSDAFGVQAAVLTDTLPEGLEFVSSDPAGSVDGRVVTWDLSDIAPGGRGEVLLTARAVAYSGNGPLINVVHASGYNAAVATAQALPLYRIGPQGNELELRHSAGVLETGLGEVIPYTITLENKGDTPLHDIVMIDTLPAGVRFVPGSLASADSARVDGRVLTIWWSGPFAPHTQHNVRFAASVVTPGNATTLVSRALAQAEAGAIVTQPAIAIVRVRRGFVMQQRVVVGKVWVDLNGDGRQQDGEQGAAGVDIWSEDGTIVTTDRQGRFSFPNLRIGEHALRIDSATLPQDMMLAERSEAIVRARLDGWTLPRVEFRLVPRPVADSPLQGQPAPPADSTDMKGAAPRVPRAPRIPPLRSDSAREADVKGSFLTGPGVRFLAPADGSVVLSNRLYVGLLGQPGAQVRLFDNDSMIAEGTLRPDGRIDFIGLEIAEGPHVLRVAMKNSWGAERLDSIALHRSGPVVKLEPALATLTMHAGDRSPSMVTMIARDEWGVPVAGNATVTAIPTGARLHGTDVDASSVGHQVKVLEDGTATVELIPNHDVGPGELRLQSNTAQARVALRILPEITPLRIVGAGQIGAGAAADAFGALTARGSIGDEVAVSIAYDTRRDSIDNYFGRGYDPFEEGRYPTLGDGSKLRETTPSARKLTARVQRGFDVLELGDVRTEEFGIDQRLGFYQRALTGMSGNITTGPISWRGYGSMTDQVLTQQQLRGNGTSGPYVFGAGIRAGTERIAIEVRAVDNAARVISRTELTRYNDYQVEYISGQVLLNQPVPASDAAGNPVFVVAMLERRTGGESAFNGGLRMDLNAASMLRDGWIDTLEVSVLGVRESRGLALEQDYNTLVGGGIRLRHGSIAAGTQLLSSMHGDSTATASLTSLAWSPFNQKLKLSGELLDVNAGFASSADPRLASGMRELRFAADLKPVETSQLRLTHEQQRFDAYEVERQATALEARHKLFGHNVSAKAGMTQDAQNDATTRSATGKLTIGVRDGMDVWLETSQLLSDRDSATARVARPSQYGIGVGVKVLKFARLEASHRWLQVHGDSTQTYQLSSLNITTEPLYGAQLRGGIERADDKRAGNSAVLGWNQKLVLGGGLTATGMFERRFGLDRTPLVDPSRALPFAQPERDRWSAGAGLEWLPVDSTHTRISVRGELHGGQEGDGYRIDIAGDAPISNSASVLMRHNWLRNRRAGSQRPGDYTRSDHSLLGVALRPSYTDALNVLAKLEWRVDMNPMRNALLGAAGEQRRLIGAVDAVWAMDTGREVALRYAARWSRLGDTITSVRPVASFAHFTGTRITQVVHGPVSIRVDARMLIDGNTHTIHWTTAPALVTQLGNGLELETGYRFGPLQDLDFAAEGGKGFYASLHLRVMETLLTRF